MEKPIDEVFIKFSSKTPVEPKGYMLGDDMEFTVKGTIVKQEDYENNDGTKNRVYVVKPIEVT